MPSPTRQARTSRWYWLLPVAAVVAIFYLSPFRPVLDRAFLDSASRHPLRKSPVPTDSAIVLIDEKTLLEMRSQGLRWPFPRDIYAQLIMSLRQAGAARIVMDFTFFEESEADLVLAGVAAATPSVVLARTKDLPPVFWTEEYRKAHPQYFRVPRAGLVELAADSDGVTRRYIVPDSLAAAAMEHPPTDSGGLLRWHGGLKDVDHAGVPVLAAAIFIKAGYPIFQRIGQAAPGMEPEEIEKALAAEPPLTGKTADVIRGRTVFVGANASGTFDLKAMPVGEIEPGVLLHWTAWTNLRSGGFIATLPQGTPAGIAVLVLCVLLLLSSRWPGVVAPTLATMLMVALLLAVSYVGLSAGWFLPPSTPAVTAVLALLGIIAENFWREQQRKREIQTMFGAYVDPGVVETLVRDPLAIRLGGEKRHATVYFSDLAGFTDLSEKLQPEELMQVVNRYLQDMSECLLDHGAYIDKYIGDAVMAVFGAPAPNPDHAVAACTGALAAKQVLAKINTELQATHGYTLAMRIGINTGEMLVGNLGSDRKKNYTVLGDAVNLSSRLEGANKEFGTEIMLGENTARAVAGKFALRPLTRLRVKGKKTAVEVYELVGRPETLTAEQKSFLDAYCAGYAHFAGRRFVEATIDFDRALGVVPSDDLTRELLDQARAYSTQPPPADWEPIITLKSK